MGRRRSPGEKRLRGLLSGDPERVARSLRRSVWTNDPEIYATIAQSKDAVIAAIGDMVLDDDATERRDWLFARFGGVAPKRREKRGCACVAGMPSGNPKSKSGFNVTQEMVHAGHSEMTVTCASCGRSFKVIEDAGHQSPQYHWRGGSY